MTSKYYQEKGVDRGVLDMMEAAIKARNFKNEHGEAAYYELIGLDPPAANQSREKPPNSTSTVDNSALEATVQELTETVERQKRKIEFLERKIEAMKGKGKERAHDNPEDDGAAEPRAKRQRPVVTYGKRVPSYPMPAVDYLVPGGTVSSRVHEDVVAAVQRVFDLGVNSKKNSPEA
jgi:hypothetical protein